MIDIKLYQFSPQPRWREYLLSLVLSYGVLGYLLLTLEPSSVLFISCAILTVFATLMLTLYHRSKMERRIEISSYGIKICRGKRLTHLPWSHVEETREQWVGHGGQRHRRFSLLTKTSEEIELLRDGEFRDTDLILSLVQQCKKEAARE